MNAIPWFYFALLQELSVIPSLIEAHNLVYESQLICILFSIFKASLCLKITTVFVTLLGNDSCIQVKWNTSSTPSKIHPLECR